MQVNLTSFEVTEYLPAYNYMQEIHVEYDFTNHRYRIDYGNWKAMTEDYEERIKKQYSIGVTTTYNFPID